MFTLGLIEHDEMKSATDLKGRRIYMTPIGPLPSVTTVLGESQDKTSLRKWREKIGDDEADAITLQARNRGTAVHSLAEKYLLNDPDWRKGEPFVNVETFLNIKSFLDEHVETVYGVEFPLYSKELKTAGRTDAIIKPQFSHNAILDFKTSKKVVKEDAEKLTVYKLQTTAYAMMAEERLSLDIPFCIICIAIDLEPTQIIQFRNVLYRNKVREIFINR